MNRLQMQFRAWHTVNKTMFTHKDIPVLLKNAKDDNVWKYMQCVGISDIEGTLMFEGDIVECLKDKVPYGANDTIEFKNGAFWLATRDVPLWYWLSEAQEILKAETDFQIIGNIYQSPGTEPINL